jgi:hypothetical protein
LPYEKGSKYAGDEVLHSGNHGKDYIDIVIERLRDVKDAGGKRTDIVNQLNQIRKELLNGNLHLN